MGASEAVAVAVAVTPVSAGEKRAQVETVLGGIFTQMDYPARLEFKDMPDGGLGVAVHFEGELPGITGTKRTYLVDCIQFLVNKVVNRPNVEKRWVTLGVGGFPEPRGPKPEAAAPSAPAASPVKGPKTAAAPAKAVAVAAAAPSAPAAAGPGKKPAPQQPQQRRGRSDHDEKSMTVEATPTMTRIGSGLAEKSAKFGRTYAVTFLSTEDRARVVAAASAVKGQSVKVEGEGYFRRVVFVPEKPTVITKRQVMPDYDDEE